MRKMMIIGVVLAVVLLTAYAVSGKPLEQDRFFTSGTQYEYMFIQIEGDTFTSTGFNGEIDTVGSPITIYELWNRLGAGGWEYMGMVNGEHLFKRIKPA